MPVLYPKYRHSVSSANLWRECPSAFLWRYGLQRWGKDNLRTWMGHAAEKAYANALLNGLSPDETAEDARKRFYDLSEGEDSEHANYAAWIARGFLEQTDPAWGKLIQHAPWRPVRIGALDREISFKPDFIFERALVDTKATLRILSTPSPTHIRQIAAYAKEWGLPGTLFYVSPQSKDKQIVGYKHSLYTIAPDEAEAACMGLLRDWRQIEAFDRRFTSVEDAAGVTPLNTDSFYWDEDQIEEAHRLWERATNERQ